MFVVRLVTAPCRLFLHATHFLIVDVRYGEMLIARKQ
jgi:hypothetical protein